MWLVLGSFLIAAVGASVVALLIDPDRRDSALNEWAILVIVLLAGAAALGILHGRWFTRIPQDAATGVTTGIFVRIAVVEAIWLITFVFFMLGIVGGTVLVASLVAAVGLAMLFAAPTSRLLGHVQDQLDALGAAIDLDTELRRPMG